jgi:hypothetical protein
MNKIRDEKGDITAHNTEIQRIIRKYFTNPCSNKLENLEEIDKFLDAFDQLKLNQKVVNHLNRFIICNEIEAVIKSVPVKNSPGPNVFTTKSYQTLKELIPRLLKLFHETEGEKHYQSHSMKSVLHSSPNWTRPQQRLLDY